MTGTLRTERTGRCSHAGVVGAHAGVVPALSGWSVFIAMREERICRNLTQAYDCAVVTIHAIETAAAIVATAVVVAAAIVATAVVAAATIVVTAAVAAAIVATVAIVVVAVVAIAAEQRLKNVNVNAIALDPFISNHVGVFLCVFIHSDGDASLLRVHLLHMKICL